MGVGVGVVAELVGVEQDLVCLAGLSEARDDHTQDIGTQVSAKGESHIVEANNVARCSPTRIGVWSAKLKFCDGCSHLVLLQPLLEELFPALLQDRTSKFNRLKMIEFTLLEENAEVLKNGRQASRGGGSSLKRLNDLSGTENAL